MISDFLFYSDSYCMICGQEKSENLMCDNCYSNLDFIDGCFPLDGAVCYFPLFYNNFIKEIIKDFKFEKKTYLLKPLADILMGHIKKMGLSFDYIAYVPMHRKDLYKRGYNQSELLAGYVAEKLGFKLISPVDKIHKTVEQNKLGRDARKNNLLNSFRCNKSCKLENKGILLIDDLVTTGATLNQIIYELRKNFEIDIVCLTLSSSRIGDVNDEFL